MSSGKIATLILFCASTTGGRAPEAEPHVLATAREVERLAKTRSLWPGFDPMVIPLAIYDGEATHLFRHPAPPEGFSRVDSQTHVYRGRHPAVMANSSAEIGGTLSATLLADKPGAQQTPRELAAVALHEIFHVFQRRRHPGWQANEGDLLLYPIDDVRLLSLRRLETEAMRRALAASADGAAHCWTKRALVLRRQRFAAMEPPFAAYERANELNEGLATYVELLAKGETTVSIPERGFPAADLRHRIYAVGPALAFLLDRFRPSWAASLETDDAQHLDELLEAALGEAAACAFTADEITTMERISAGDAAGVATARIERRRSFDAIPGWRVVVEATNGEPLWPQGFDPLNIDRVEGGLLHTRFLRLGNDAGELNVVDGEGADLESLTVGVGPHPLFNGLRRAVIAALAKPRVEAEGAHVFVRAPGLTVDFDDAIVEERGTTLIVQLKPGETSP